MNIEKTYWVARWKCSGNFHKETQASGPKLYPSLKMARARVGGEKSSEHFDFIEVRVIVA